MANKKIFPHAVIYNGVFYPANTPIEVAEKPSATPKPTKKAVKNNDNERTV